MCLLISWARTSPELSVEVYYELLFDTASFELQSSILTLKDAIGESLLAIPLRARGVILGVLDLSDHDVETPEVIADRIRRAEDDHARQS